MHVAEHAVTADDASQEQDSFQLHAHDVQARNDPSGRVAFGFPFLPKPQPEGQASSQQRPHGKRPPWAGPLPRPGWWKGPWPFPEERPKPRPDAPWSDRPQSTLRPIPDDAPWPPSGSNIVPSNEKPVTDLYLPEHLQREVMKSELVKLNVQYWQNLLLILPMTRVSLSQRFWQNLQGLEAEAVDAKDVAAWESAKQWTLLQHVLQDVLKAQEDQRNSEGLLEYVKGQHQAAKETLLKMENMDVIEEAEDWKAKQLEPGKARVAQTQKYVTDVEEYVRNSTAAAKEVVQNLAHRIPPGEGHPFLPYEPGGGTSFADAGDVLEALRDAILVIQTLFGELTDAKVKLHSQTRALADAQELELRLLVLTSKAIEEGVSSLEVEGSQEGEGLHAAQELAQIRTQVSGLEADMAKSTRWLQDTKIKIRASVERTEALVGRANALIFDPVPQTLARSK